MPQSTTSLDAHISGTTGAAGTSINYVTFDAPYQFTSLQDPPNPPAPAPGAIANVPSILYYAGTIKARMDNQGNVVFEALNTQGQVPY